MQNQPYFKLKNLGTYFSIFHNFRNWATFSHHFWTIQLMLQPFITNGIIAILKIKSALCGETPCRCDSVNTFLVYYIHFLLFFRFEEVTVRCQNCGQTTKFCQRGWNRWAAALIVIVTPAAMVRRPPFKCLYSTKWKCQRRAQIQIEAFTYGGT